MMSVQSRRLRSWSRALGEGQKPGLGPSSGYQLQRYGAVGLGVWELVGGSLRDRRYGTDLVEQIEDFPEGMDGMVSSVMVAASIYGARMEARCQGACGVCVRIVSNM